MTTLALTERCKPRPKVPGYLVFEELNGRPLYYRGYRDVLKGIKTPEEIRGSSDIQAIVVSALLSFIQIHVDRKQYFIATNNSGLHLSKGNNLQQCHRHFREKRRTNPKRQVFQRTAQSGGGSRH